MILIAKAIILWDDHIISHHKTFLYEQLIINIKKKELRTRSSSTFYDYIEEILIKNGGTLIFSIEMHLKS